MVTCIGLKVRWGPCLRLLTNVVCSVVLTVGVAYAPVLVIVVRVVRVVSMILRLGLLDRLLVVLTVNLLLEISRNLSTFGVRCNALTCLRISGIVVLSICCLPDAGALVTKLVLIRNGMTCLARLGIDSVWT